MGEEWEVVRRKRCRKETKGHNSSQPKGTSVIPSGAFSALAPPDEPRQKTEEERNRETKKKKAARERQKKARQAQAVIAEDASAGGEKTHLAPPTPGPSKPIPAQPQPEASKPAGGAAPQCSSSFSFHAVLAVLWAVLAWCKAMLGLGRREKAKRKVPIPTCRQQEDIASTLANTKPHATIISAQPGSQEHKDEGKEAQVLRPTQGASAGKAPSKPAPSPIPAAAPPAASTGTAGGAASRTAAAPPVQPPSTKQADPGPRARVFHGPALQCDQRWVAGRYVVAEHVEAHADAVSSVAAVGQVAITTGYDGSVKVWLVCSRGGPPKLLKTLAGHSGRVEAVVADAARQRAVTSGRDSSLKVWAIGTTAETATSSHLLHSHYVYESVSCLAVNWAASPPVAALGAASGNISLFDLDTGRKLAVLKRHDAEVSSVVWLPYPRAQAAAPAGSAAVAEEQALSGAAAGLLVSGSSDGGLMAWDVRQPHMAALAGRLQGARQRVCSMVASSQWLYVGDYSSTVKIYDMAALAGPTHTLQPLAELPVAPSADAFGDICPVAGLALEPQACVLLSSGIAWWSDEDWEAVVEAPESERVPCAVLSVHAVADQAHEYLNTVRLGKGIATCTVVQDMLTLVGCSTGSLFSVSLSRQGKALPPEAHLSDNLVVGCEELEEEEEEEDSEGTNEQ